LKKKISKSELLDKIVDDYTRRTREGEAPEISAYKRKYPAIANDIEDVLSSVAMIEGLKAEAATQDPAGDATQNADLVNRKQIGEYVLIREVGRGGMGVVYEAVHQSLGRRVALKIMLEKELESEKQIARFRREAQAAARLHHTNIVSVFGVGEFDGYHYYVMEYVDGISLKSAVESLTTAGTSVGTSVDKTELQGQTVGDGNVSTVGNSELIVGDGESFETNDESQQILVPKAQNRSLFSSDPNRFRWVGKIGAQVADALGYSHEMGMLHRDIKPANLMLDDKGQVWITDFGLVKIADEEQLTKTGAVMGTPQYLAPESLKGHYDQKSETYCLGLSLYELATLQPAFAPGSHAEVFNRVIHETPVVPRKVDPSIPLDLATIIEKAISKDPNDRYDNAIALRDDLRAFVEDRPISARPLSIWEQSMRWAKKNPVVASLAGLSAALLLATAIIASSAWAITSRAYAKAEENLNLAEANYELALLNESLANDNEKEAIKNWERSEANVQLMVETFDELFVDFLQKDSKSTADKFDFDGFNELAGIEISIDESDAAYLKKMADFYERFANQNVDNEDLLDNAAKGWRRVANINFLIGDDKAANESYRKAVESYIEILKRNPDSTESLLNLVSTRSEMSNAVRRMAGKLTPALLINQNLTAIEKHPQQNDPQVQFAKAETLTALASAEVWRLAAENVVDLDRLADDRWRPMQPSKPGYYDKQARQYVEQALKIANGLIENDSDNLEYQLLLGRCHSSLGALEQHFGEKELAVESLNKAVDLFKSLSKQHPENPNYRYQAAVTLMLMPTENSESITQKQIEAVQATADSLVQKSPNAAYVQLQIVARLKLADYFVVKNQAGKAIDELIDAATLVKSSELKGPAEKSMVRAVSQTVRSIAQTLSLPQRREFMGQVQNLLGENFRRHSPRGGRRRGPGAR